MKNCEGQEKEKIVKKTRTRRICEEQEQEDL
jgi:hypothetical protein